MFDFFFFLSISTTSGVQDRVKKGFESMLGQESICKGKHHRFLNFYSSE